jgi:hypothetical protein
MRIPGNAFKVMWNCCFPVIILIFAEVVKSFLMSLKRTVLFFLLLTGFSGFAQNVAINQPFEEFTNWGQALTVADFNNDGLNDIVALAPKLPKNNKPFGAFTLHYNTENGFHKKPDLIIHPELPGFNSGISHCAAGDFNTDGFTDLVVSNPFYGEPQLDRGFVQVFWGSTEGIIAEKTTVKTGLTAYGSFGSNVACLDFNGDGTDDLLVEARFDQILEGRIYIYYGGENFSLESPDIALKVENSQSLYFCFSDDLNSDGIADVVCRSNSNWNTTKTQVSIFYGGINPNETHSQYFEMENFTPLFYCKNEKVFFGTVRDNTNIPSTEAFKITTSGFQTLNIKTEGIPFKISGNKIMLIRNYNDTGLYIYAFRNNEFLFLRKIEKLAETTTIRLPSLFQNDITAPQKLLVPVLTADGEKLVFINPEE